MPFPTDYAGWISTVRDWVDVDDLVDAQIGVCLSLAQIRMNRELSSQWMESSEVITVVTGGIPIPIIPLVPDFNRVRLVVSGQNLVPLGSLAINEFQSLVANNSINGGLLGNNGPAFYCIEGQALNVFPYEVDGAQLTLYYYMQVPELSAIIPSNIFSQYHPDMLLFAASLEASKFIVEDERVETWNSAYNLALVNSNDVAKNAKLGSTPLKRQITMYANNQ